MTVFESSNPPIKLETLKQMSTSSRNVYGVSVDSRSRNVNEPDNCYTVNLFRDLQRVKTVQLGSFQFHDARPAFETDATFKFSEPIPIPADTYLRFEETVTTYTKATRATTTEVRRVSLLLPPTINQITAIAGNVVTAANDTGLFFGTRFYPGVGLRMKVVGADFPPDLAAFTTPSFPTDAGPLLTDATTVSPYLTNTSNSFTYATNYLAELSGGVGSTDARHFSAGAYRSYIYAPPPTLTELFVMINDACNFLNTRVDISDTVTGATNATPIVITSSVANGLVTGDEVVISGVTGNTAANGTWLITALTSSTFQLVGSAGNGVYAGGGTLFSPQQLNVSVLMGFDNNTNTICATAPKRVADTSLTTVTRSVRLIDSFASLLGFNDVRLDPPGFATIPSSIIRTITFKDGTLLPDEIANNTTSRLNAGDFTDETVANRTLHFIMPVGIADSVVVDYGRYDGTQLAAFLTSQLNPLPNQITVTYNDTAGTFTFAQDVGLQFGLDFVTSSPLMRERLGFDQLVYTGSNYYTSVRRAVHGVTSNSITFPQNEYAITMDSNNQHFTIRTESPITLHTVSGTSTSNVDAQWTPLAGNSLPFAHHFQPGDILTAMRPTFSSTQDGSKAITAATNASPIAITTAGNHGLTTGDNLTIQRVEGNTAANGTWFITVTGLTTFTLDGTTGNGTYTSATGEWWTNVTWDALVAAQVPSPVYTVVLQAVWDATTATPILQLEPTASIFSVQDAATPARDPLGTPATTDGRIILTSARRNVFMMHFEHPDGSPPNLGFPPVAWPPSEKNIIQTSTSGTTFLRSLPNYDQTTLSIPVAGSYTSPFTWNVLPPDYVVIVLRASYSAQDNHTHSYRGTSFPIFAKLLITFPYINVSEEMSFTTFAGHERFNNMTIEFQNPDGTLVNFNGRPHTFTLLFTVEEDRAVLPCF
jgi:hypothetical protein